MEILTDQKNKEGGIMNEIGDVIYRNNIKFKDNGKLDSRVKGHPTINISGSINGKIYYLSVTSSRKIIKRDYNFYKIKDKKNSKLTKQSSYVNLDLIYEEDESNKVEVGYIATPEMATIAKSILENFDSVIYENSETIGMDKLADLKNYLKGFIEKYNKIIKMKKENNKIERKMGING